MNVITRLLSPFWEAQGLSVQVNGSGEDSPNLKEFNSSDASFSRRLGKGEPPNPLSGAFTKMYSINSTVYRCVNVISASLASLPVKVYSSADKTDRVDLTANKEFDILQKPTDFMTGYDFWEWTSGFLELQGEAFWVLNLSPTGKIKEMIPVRPDKMTIVPDPATRVAGYVFTNNDGRKFPLQPEEVIYLHYWSPNSDFRGQSPIMAAAGDLELDIRAVSANTALFKQGARPSGVVSTKEYMTTEQFERFKEMVVDQYEGQLNQGKIMFLEGDAKWHQIGLKSQDMQYMETRAWTKDTVGEVLGVPPLLRMDLENSSVLENTQAQKEVFWESTMTPKTRKLAAAITMSLIPRLTNNASVVMEFDLSEVKALQSNKEQLNELVDAAVRRAGMTPAMATMLVFGIEIDDPLANILYIDSSLVPLGTVPAEPEPKYIDVIISNIDETIKLLEGPTDEIEATKMALAVIEKSREDWWATDQKIKGANAVETVLNSQEDKFVKTLRGLFDEQMKDVLRKLRTNSAFWGKANKDLIAQINFDMEEWVQRFENGGKPHIAAGLRQAGEDLADAVGGTYDVNGDPRAAGYINTEARTYALQVNNTTQIKVDAILRSSLEANLSITDTAALIERYFVESAIHRANLIARTELVKATNQGRVDSMVFNGFTKHMWATQRDSKVRDEHAKMDGEVVDIGKSFSNGDNYPQDVNERCYTIPVRENN